ncbi:hypothetical protein MHYP_G00107340 [Metynnis hypsauchen]
MPIDINDVFSESCISLSVPHTDHFSTMDSSIHGYGYKSSQLRGKAQFYLWPEPQCSLLAGEKLEDGWLTVMSWRPSEGPVGHTPVFGPCGPATGRLPLSKCGAEQQQCGTASFTTTVSSPGSVTTEHVQLFS